MNLIMHFISTSMLLIFLVTFSAFTSAQVLNQNQTCSNACTAAGACNGQCTLGTTYNPQTNTDIWTDCLCQSGCLCNAEICLQCCEAAGVSGADSDSFPFNQLFAAKVLDICSIVSLPFPFSCERNRSKGEDIGVVSEQLPCILHLCDRMVQRPQKQGRQKLVSYTVTAKMGIQLQPTCPPHLFPPV